MEAEKTREFLRYYFPYNDGLSREKEIENIEKDAVYQELAELERLAMIGKATIESYHKGFYIMESIAETCVEPDGFPTIEELLEWYEKEVK